VQFNYPVEQFNFLTLKQIVEALNFKFEYDQSIFGFWQKELRTNNFFTLKASFGDTSKFTKPEDLYLFADERQQAKEDLIEVQDQLGYWLSSLTNELAQE
jgi:hypothetical protein